MDDAGKTSMKVVPLARHLAELPGTSAKGAGATPADVAAAHERAIEEARARGEERGRETARREYETLLATEREGLGTRLGDERRRWTEKQAERLARDIEGQFATLAAALASAAARLLEP